MDDVYPEDQISARRSILFGSTVFLAFSPFRRPVPSAYPDLILGIFGVFAAEGMSLICF